MPETMLQSLIKGHGDLLFPDMPFADVASLCVGGLYYLATPYSRNVLDEEGQFDRIKSIEMWKAAAGWQAHCLLWGITVVSPIVQSVAMVETNVGADIDPLDAWVWGQWCAPMLAACCGVIVPPIAGWDESDGIEQEVIDALRANVPVYLVASGSDGYGGG